MRTKRKQGRAFAHEMKPYRAARRWRSGGTRRSSQAPTEQADDRSSTLELSNAPMPNSDAAVPSGTEDRTTTLSVEEAIRASTPKKRAPRIRKGGPKAGAAKPKTPLVTVEQVLAWADAWHDRTGRWPRLSSGVLPEAPTENWSKIDQALRTSRCDLPEPTSIARLLALARGVPNPAATPRLSIAEILEWADAWRERTGRWPTNNSGPVFAGAVETWGRVTSALYEGIRGLPGGSSLAKLLAEHRGARSYAPPPKLTVEKILRWAEDHKSRTGQWPVKMTKSPPNATGDTWCAIDEALRKGYRGLPGGSSLCMFLGKRKPFRNERSKIRISEDEILAWADAHYDSTGNWPTKKSGSVAAMPGETWIRLDAALLQGCRGLPGGSSLPRLLEHRRGIRNAKHLPAITFEQILRWADAWHAINGDWPSVESGTIPGESGLTWHAVNSALRSGGRGLQGSISLSDLLWKERGRTKRLISSDLPDLTEQGILEWADRHYEAKGRWPTSATGPIDGTQYETWGRIDYALKRGNRGLTGGRSLPKLLSQFRGVITDEDKPALTERLILSWADRWYERTGKWPGERSGLIPDTTGENWDAVNSALRKGFRGLPGRSSLARLRLENRTPDGGG